MPELPYGQTVPTPTPGEVTVMVGEDNDVYMKVGDDWQFVGYLSMAGPAGQVAEQGATYKGEEAKNILASVTPGTEKAPGAPAGAMVDDLAARTDLGPQAVVALMQSLGLDPDSFAQKYPNIDEAAGVIDTKWETLIGKQRVLEYWTQPGTGEGGETVYPFFPSEASQTSKEKAMLEEWGAALEAGAPGEGPPPDFDPFGAMGAGDGGVGGVGMDYPPSAAYDLEKWMQGGPATLGAFWDYMDLPGEAYSGISRMASPLSYAQGDPYEFMSRMTQPGQFYPGAMYTLAGKAGLPMGLSMPEEFYGMMGEAMPSGIAPGTPTPDFSFLEGLGQAPDPGMANFLMSLIQPQSPELPLAMIQALLSMQQEGAMPFLELLMSPGGIAGGGQAGASADNFLAALLGGGGM